MASITERINNPAKLVQCIQCHNEEEFIGLTLESIYDEVDQIIVIEGAVENRPNATPDGHSIDKTWEIIQDFVKNRDTAKKVLPVRIKKPWKNLEELKQQFINFTSEGDWLVINDADEFYRPEDIRRVRRAIDLYPHAAEFVPTFLHFYRDFCHVAAPAPEWQPQHQRIFKRINGMKYNSHPIVTLPDGHCSYFSNHVQLRRYLLDKFFIFHYGYARLNMDDRMKEKRAYYEKELAKHGAANKEFDTKIKTWLERTEPDNSMLRFPISLHPASALKHPMASYVDSGFAGRSFKAWEEDRLYSKVLANEPYGNIWLCMNNISPPAIPFFHNQITLPN